MTAHSSPSTPTPLALSLALEFDRSSLPSGGSAFARLIVSAPQSAATSCVNRRGLALALAMDTSGSMSDPAGSPDGSPMRFSVPAQGIFGVPNHRDSANTKMERCKAAAWEAISLLGDDDMASLTAFSSMAKTLFPMSPMTEANKAKFKTALDKLSASGGTALHDGWSEAGREAAKGLDRQLLCRVAMLTDGEPSPGGITNPEELARQSAKLASLGISTSCFGVGASFNEDLLCAMADAGEGNFRYIPDAMLASAAAIDEVNGLGATAGRKARLRLIAEDGAESVELFNTFDKIDAEWFKLPALLAGRPIEAVAKLTLKDDAPLATLRVEVSWEDRDGIAQSAHTSLSAAVIDKDAALALPQNAEVAGAAAAFEVAKSKASVAQMISQGDFDGAKMTLDSATAMFSSTLAYSGLSMEMSNLNALSASLQSGNHAATRKMAMFDSYSRTKNQSVSPTTSLNPVTAPAAPLPTPKDSAHHQKPKT